MTSIGLKWWLVPLNPWLEEVSGKVFYATVEFFSGVCTLWSLKYLPGSIEQKWFTTNNSCSKAACTQMTDLHLTWLPGHELKLELAGFFLMRNSIYPGVSSALDQKLKDNFFLSLFLFFFKCNVTTVITCLLQHFITQLNVQHVVVENRTF